MTRPGQGWSGGQAGLSFLPERDGCYLVDEIPAAAENRTQYRLVPEHGLDPHGGPGHPVADDRLPPQRELLPGGADDLIGRQPQRRDAALGVLFGIRPSPGALLGARSWEPRRWEPRRRELCRWE